MSLSAEGTAGHDKPGGETGMAVLLAGREEQNIERFGLEHTMHTQAQMWVCVMQKSQQMHTRANHCARLLDPSLETQ